jgi:tape measure domain-containing protein
VASNNSQVRYYITATDKTGAAWRSANGRVQRHRKLLGGLRAPIQRAKLAVVQFNASLGAIPAAGLAGIIASFGVLGKAVFATNMKMDAFMNSMIVSTGSVALAEKEIKKIEKLTDTLGLNFLSTADAYKKFSIAAKEVGMASSTSDKIFRSVAKASAAMGLSAENTRLTLKALEQMISKGTVQSEELRGQMGEHLPGAFGMAAKAMNVTTRQLSKMLEQGEILAVDLLPKLADVLENKFASVAVRASTQARASFERMKNAWVKFLVVFGQTGVYGKIESGIKSVTAALKDMNTEIESGKPQAKFTREWQATIALFKLLKVYWLKFASSILEKMVTIDRGFQVFFRLKQTFLNLKVVFLGLVVGVLEGISKMDTQITAFWNAWTYGDRKVSKAIVGSAAIAEAKFRDAKDDANKYWTEHRNGANQSHQGLVKLAKTMKDAIPAAIAEWKTADDVFSSPIDKAIVSAEVLKQSIADADITFAQLNKGDSAALGGGMDASIFDDFSNDRFMSELQEMEREIRDITQLSADFVGSFSDGLSVQLTQALMTGKMNFKQFALSIIADLTAMIIKALLFRMIMGLLGGLGSLFSGAASAGGATTFGLGAAPIGVETNMLTGVTGTFASGGAVSGGVPIIVGEQGREVFVPNSDGSIIPNHNINKSNSNIQSGQQQDVAPLSVTFNINAIDTQTGVGFLVNNKQSIIGMIDQAYRKQGRRGVSA